VLSLPEGEYEIEVSARDLTTSKTTVKVGKDTEERISAELRYLPRRCAPPRRRCCRSTTRRRA